MDSNDMPGVFKELDLYFQYPDNWSVEHEANDSDETGQGGQVVVSSPHTAFWQLSQLQPDTELEALFDEALSALRIEYENIEVEPSGSENIEGLLVEGYDVRFFYLDLTNTCWLRGFSTADANYLLLCQAEDQEFADVCPVFRAMLASLLQNLDGPTHATSGM